MRGLSVPARGDDAGQGRRSTWSRFRRCTPPHRWRRPVPVSSPSRRTATGWWRSSTPRWSCCDRSPICCASSPGSRRSICWLPWTTRRPARPGGSTCSTRSVGRRRDRRRPGRCPTWTRTRRRTTDSRGESGPDRRLGLPGLHVHRLGSARRSARTPRPTCRRAQRARRLRPGAGVYCLAPAPAPGDVGPLGAVDRAARRIAQVYGLPLLRYRCLELAVGAAAQRRAHGPTPASGRAVSWRSRSPGAPG